MLVAGRWDVFEKIMRMNVSNMKRKGVKTVITSCPACWLMWHTVYPQWAKKLGIEFGLETKHYSEVLVERLDVLKPKFKKPLDKGRRLARFLPPGKSWRQSVRASERIVEVHTRNSVQGT